RMRRVECIHQPCRIDLRVELRRRERRMDQQFLNPAQVSALGEQVCGEGMAQGMGRSAVRQAERAAQFLYRKLDDARRQGGTPAPDQKRARGAERLWGQV